MKFISMSNLSMKKMGEKIEEIPFLYANYSSLIIWYEKVWDVECPLQGV